MDGKPGGQLRDARVVDLEVRGARLENQEPLGGLREVTNGNGLGIDLPEFVVGEVHAARCDRQDVGKRFGGDRDQVRHV